VNTLLRLFRKQHLLKMANYKLTKGNRLESMIDKTQTSAPDFTMIDSEGRSIHLSDYKRKKNVFLVFNRGFT